MTRKQNFAIFLGRENWLTQMRFRLRLTDCDVLPSRFYRYEKRIRVCSRWSWRAVETRFPQTIQVCVEDDELFSTLVLARNCRYQSVMNFPHDLPRPGLNNLVQTCFANLYHIVRNNNNIPSPQQKSPFPILPAPAARDQYHDHTARRSSGRPPTSARRGPRNRGHKCVWEIVAADRRGPVRLGNRGRGTVPVRDHSGPHTSMVNLFWLPPSHPSFLLRHLGHPTNVSQYFRQVTLIGLSFVTDLALRQMFHRFFVRHHSSVYPSSPTSLLASNSSLLSSG